MKRRIVKSKILTFTLTILLIGGVCFNRPYYASLEEYGRYSRAYSEDWQGVNKGITYPDWWGDTVDRYFLSLRVCPELTPEEAVLYAQEIDKWAPGHGGDIIINAVYAQGYGVETVDAMKQAGYLPADYIHPAAAGQAQQPVADAAVVPETQPQQTQPAAVEQTPQPQTSESNQSDKPVKEESIVEETVESETVVETTESEETTVESTEESVETETTTETAEESSESMETEETTVEEEKDGFPVVPVLIGLVIFIGLSVGGVLLWKKKK